VCAVRSCTSGCSRSTAQILAVWSSEQDASSLPAAPGRAGQGRHSTGSTGWPACDLTWVKETDYARGLVVFRSPDLSTSRPCRFARRSPAASATDKNSLMQARSVHGPPGPSSHPHTAGAGDQRPSARRQTGHGVHAHAVAAGIHRHAGPCAAQASGAPRPQGCCPLSRSPGMDAPHGRGAAGPRAPCGSHLMAFTSSLCPCSTFCGSAWPRRQM